MNKAGIAISIVLFVFFLFWRYSKSNQIDLINNHEILQGRFSELAKGYKGGTSGYIVIFFYNGKEYHTRHYSGSKDHGIFLNSYFPVIIEKGNPENNRVLVFPNDFDEVDLEFPDSLNWVNLYR